MLSDQSSLWIHKTSPSRSSPTMTSADTPFDLVNMIQGKRHTHRIQYNNLQLQYLPLYLYVCLRIKIKTSLEKNQGGSVLSFNAPPFLSSGSCFPAFPRSSILPTGCIPRVNHLAVYTSLAKVRCMIVMFREGGRAFYCPWSVVHRDGRVVKHGA